jgi:hypothetical protein
MDSDYPVGIFKLFLNYMAFQSFDYDYFKYCRCIVFGRNEFCCVFSKSLNYLQLCFVDIKSDMN